MAAVIKRSSLSKQAGSAIVVALLILAAVLIAGLARCQGSAAPPDGLAAKVTVDSQVQMMLPLDTNTRQVVHSEQGTNTVVVSGGSVHIEDADCKGHDCEKQGSVTRVGQMLVCLPHKLIVEIVPAESDPKEPSRYQEGQAVGEFDVVAR